MILGRCAIVIGLLTGALYSVLAASAQEQGNEPIEIESLTFMFSGDEYYRKGGDFRAGYAVGSLDAFLLSVYLNKLSDQVHDFSDCKNDWTLHEIRTIIDRYILQEVSERDHGAAEMLHAALKADCLSAPSP